MPGQVDHALAHGCIHWLALQIEHTADAAHGQGFPDARLITVDLSDHLPRRTDRITNPVFLSKKLLRNPTAAPHHWDIISVTRMLSGLDSSMLAGGTNIRYTMDALTFGGLSASGHRPSKRQLGARKRRATSNKILRVRR